MAEGFKGLFKAFILLHYMEEPLIAFEEGAVSFACSLFICAWTNHGQIRPYYSQ